MLWTVLVESPPESVWKDWTLHPRFIKDSSSSSSTDGPRGGRVFWAVGLTHKHGSKLEHCGVVEKENANSGFFGKYECSKCGQRAPIDVVSAKHKKLESLKGTDPRIDRRGAILATRKKLST